VDRESAQGSALRWGGGRSRLVSVGALALAAGILAACGGGGGGAGNSGGSAPKASNPNAARSGAPAVSIHFCTPKPAANAADPCWKNAIATSLSNVMAGSMPSGFSATFQAVWDSKNLYVLNQVKDSQGFSASNANTTTPWTSDAMEVYLSSTNSTNTAMGANETQIDIPIGQPSSVWVYTGRNSAGVQGYVQKVSGGYDAMMAIPWSDIGTNPGVGQVIGMDPAEDVYSDGTTQNQALAWGNPGSSEQNPSIWGQVKLVQ